MTTLKADLSLALSSRRGDKDGGVRKPFRVNPSG